MKKKYIFGNWKSYKTAKEAGEWFASFVNEAAGDKDVVLFVPFVLLPILQEQARSAQVFLGAQDVSPFSEGPYTGEVHARQVKDYVTHVLVGHSERRENFHETNEILSQKVTQALDAGLNVVYCVQNAETMIPNGVTCVAYEPPNAIGSGNADTPENANSVASEIRKNNSAVTTIIYGGSVTKENVSSFIIQQALDGVLVGSKSLDPDEFSNIISYA